MKNLQFKSFESLEINNLILIKFEIKQCLFNYNFYEPNTDVTILGF